MRKSANFEIVESNPERVLIKDVGPWDKHPTITNDSERVVQRLVAGFMGVQLGDRRLEYIDSEGSLDELLVKDGRFAGFKFKEFAKETRHPDFKIAPFVWVPKNREIRFFANINQKQTVQIDMKILYPRPIIGDMQAELLFGDTIETWKENTQMEQVLAKDMLRLINFRSKMEITKNSLTPVIRWPYSLLLQRPLIWFGEYENDTEGSLSNLEDKLKKILNFQWGNSNTRMKCAGGKFSTHLDHPHLDKFPKAPKTWRLTIWGNNGRDSIYKRHFPFTGFEDKLPKKIYKEIYAICDLYVNGYMLCSDCRKKTMLENMGGRLYAGLYCKECWEREWKEREANENYY